jgi:hypothetical protein
MNSLGPVGWAATAAVVSTFAALGAWWAAQAEPANPSATVAQAMVGTASALSATNSVAATAPAPTTAPKPRAASSTLRAFEAQPVVQPTTVAVIPSAWRIVGVSGAGAQLSLLVDQPGQEQLLMFGVGQLLPDGSKLVALTAKTATVQVAQPNAAGRPGLGKQLIVLDL